MAIRRMPGGNRYGDRKINSRMSRKLAGLFVVVVLLFVVLAIRITYINAKSGDQYARQVLAQSQGEYASTILPFKRGDILDANGMTLATSEKRYNVILDCKVVNSDEDYLEPTIEALSEIFDIDVVGVRSLLTDEKTMNSQYQIVSRNVTIEQKQDFENYKNPEDKKDLSKEEQARLDAIKGVWFEENYIRVYPFNELACDVIGFTNGDNSADWGIEGYYSNTLNGADGRKYGYWSDEDLTQTIVDPTDGRSLVSTIDINIQRIIEDEIASFSTKYANGPWGPKAAKNIGVVVMDPNTGEILGMGSSDPYDLNNPRDLTAYYTTQEIAAMSDEDKVANLQKLWRNYCISDAYEPGSVFKPMTVSAAFEDGSLTGMEEYICDGGQEVAGVYIKCSDVNGHGHETNLDAIRNSCNDALMQIAEKMGQEEFCKYQRMFNFGSRTGIDLSGEAAGILFDASGMSDVDLATSSFGQGFTCTMIQEISALASVINGGYYYQPHVISKVLDSEGATIKTIEPTVQKQTISEEVSDELRRFMKASVDDGTSVYSKVDGYSMGG
ncbi:MAG: cell division protein FtsI, partial [Lachnospiraceae bacterium]|nr:cell division protein FtsI [Candidatus Equihabitans merdae]